MGKMRLPICRGTKANWLRVFSKSCSSRICATDWPTMHSRKCWRNITRRQWRIALRIICKPRWRFGRTRRADVFSLAEDLPGFTLGIGLGAAKQGIGIHALDPLAFLHGVQRAEGFQFDVGQRIWVGVNFGAGAQVGIIGAGEAGRVNAESSRFANPEQGVGVGADLIGLFEV